jgi:tetratricopeptide (TPR) repeat protein
MWSLAKNLSERDRNLSAVCAVFFGVFYLFLWLYIEPQLYHHFETSRRSLFFETGWPFLRDYLSYPSGMSQYLAAFLTQLCYFPWLGALCITLIAWGIYRLTSSLTAIKTDSLWQVICYMPSILILMVCSRYENPLSTGVAVLIAAFFSVMYEKFSPRKIPTRGTLFLIICGVLYYIAGSAVLIFVALAALYEFFHQPKPAFGVLYLLLGAAVYWLLDTHVFDPETSELFLYSHPFSQIERNLEWEKWTRVFEGALFIGIPFIVLLVNSGQRLAGTMGVSRPRAQRRRNKSATKKKIPGRSYLNRLNWVLQLVLLGLIAVPSICFFHESKLRKMLQMDYFHCRRKWPEVLAVAETIPLDQYHPGYIHAINRALYHTGRMGDEMFTYVQAYEIEDLVFFRGGIENVVLMGRIELCLELGLVNVAERIAQEFLRWMNDRPNPFVLKQLALIYMTKGEIETARVHLRALSRNLIYGSEAKNLLHHLKTDPLLEHDEHIQHLRSIMITTDDAYTYYNENDCLTRLLQRNKYNKMAFEYLMAHYLLTRQLDKFVENLHRLDDFGYESIPQHYQEAILLYESTTQKKIDLGDRQINAETLRQFEEFNSIGSKFEEDKRILWQELAPKLGRTYFFYFFFGISGVTQ